MKCPYCGKDVHLVTGEEIYPHRNDLHMKNFWLCKPCYVPNSVYTTLTQIKGYNYDLQKC
jgi:uncharacterized protein with PIN domain